MILEKEINLINDPELKGQIINIVTENEEWFREYPVSISGKYHRHEPTMDIHIERCVYFANELCREFDIKADQRDIIIAATILHDIGHTEIAKKGDIPGWKYYSVTNWSCDGRNAKHPTIGADIIRQKNIKYANEIADLIAVHMSHWNKADNPEPKDLPGYIVCMADYFASREEVIIKKGGN